MSPEACHCLSSKHFIDGDDDLEEIKRFLFSNKGKLNGDGDIPPVIALVGMGGLGKTTLAQSVYNDPQVQKRFNKKIWVCVSEEFDLVRLTRDMLPDLKEYRDLTQLNSLQKKLVEIVNEKKLLLVVDDIWEHRNLNATSWGDLCKPLLGVSTGSKIIVTTRDRNILDGVITPARVHPLPYLSNDDCCMLFSQYAFEGRDFDIEDHNLLDIGKKISNKCRGLPLAAKTLGSLLSRQDDKEWKYMLKNSDTWGSDDQNPIMPILRLSYQYLPTELKKCYRYLSVFPKDYNVLKEQLVRMWMAHGYITRTEQRKEKQPEDIGEKYINELVSRSLFEQSRDVFNDEIFTMHDLIHDLVREASQGEWCSVEDGMFEDRQDDNFLHLSVISIENYPQEHAQWQHNIRSQLDFHRMLEWSGISKMKWLRVLHLDDFGNSLYYLEPLDCISDLKHLRYLYISSTSINKLPESVRSLHLLESLDLDFTMICDLPDSIGFLKRLRYLGLSNTDITYLPESLGMFDQLHTLNVKGVHCCLPDSIAKLSSLRRLFCKDDLVLPSEIRKLTDLYTLNEYENGRHVIVKEFTDLVNVDEAKKASSYSKEHLKVLSLVWHDNPSSTAYHLHGDVLESLGRHPNLRQFYLQEFAGSSLPFWLTNPRYLSRLVRIDLVRCEQLASSSIDDFKNLRVLKIIKCPQLQLLHLGGLRSLQHLYIKEFNQDIPFDFSSGGFPALESIELEDLPNWRSWAGPKKKECWSLRKLSIVGCSSLKNFSVSCHLRLKDICVKDCPVLEISWDDSKELHRMEKYCKTNIQEIKILSHGYDSPEAMEQSQKLPPDILLWNLNTVEHLVINKCDTLKSIFSEELPSSLKSIKLYGCHNMTDLQLGNQCALEYLNIMYCYKLSKVEYISSILRFLQMHCSAKSVFHHPGNLSNVKYLSIRNCVFEFSHVLQLPSTLKVLKIDQAILLEFVKCFNLTLFPFYWLEDLEELKSYYCSQSLGFEHMKWLPPKLKKLKISHCSDLTFFPLHVLENLEELKIIAYNGPDVFTDTKWLPSTLKILEINNYLNQSFSMRIYLSLDRLYALECLKLIYSPPLCFPHEKSLPSTLQELYIIGCPELKEWCKRNKQRLRDIPLLNIGEEQQNDEDYNEDQDEADKDMDEEDEDMDEDKDKEDEDVVEDEDKDKDKDEEDEDVDEEDEDMDEDNDEGGEDVDEEDEHMGEEDD